MRIATAAVLALSAALLAPPAAAGAEAPARAAYHGTVVAGENPKTTPENKATGFHGQPLKVVPHPIGAASGEPTIGVDKKGDVFFPADNFDNADGAVAHTDLLRSTDRGKTWKNVSPTFQGQPTHQKSLDTYLYLDKDLGRVFFVDLLGGASQITRSDDQGTTWNEGFGAALGVNDHETITTGVPPAGFSLPLLDPTFPKLAYYCANTVAEVTCARSLDGGRTFTQVNSPFPTHITNNPPLSALCSSLTGHLITDKDGRLYVASSWNSPACDGRVFVAMSPDGGMTWNESVISDKVLNPEHEVTLAADKAGTIYATWDDSLHHLPYLAVSKDHGATWSKPIMIAPPGVTESNFPTIDASRPGRIAVGFPGSQRTSTTDTKRAWQYYMVVSSDADGANP